MFDLLLRDPSGVGVPVPIAGRGMLFAGLDGVLRVKLSSGAVVLPVAAAALETGAPKVLGETFNYVGNFSPASADAALALALASVERVTGNFAPSLGAAITVFSMPGLVEVTGSFSPNTMAGLTALNVGKLERAGSFSPNIMAGMLDMDLSSLETVGAFSPNTMAAIVVLNLPKLKKVAAFSCATMAALNEVNLPMLTHASGGIKLSNVPLLPGLALPAIVDMGAGAGGWSLSADIGTAVLKSVVFGSTLKRVVGGVSISVGVLSQISLNGILVSLASLDGANGSTRYEGKTVNLIGSGFAPTGAGLVAKSVLVERGCSVTTN